MRLLLISGAYPPTRAGEAEHARLIAEHLVARGVEVQVITSERGDASSPDAMVCARVQQWSWRGLPRLLWLIWRNRPDVLLLMYIDWIYDEHPMITFLPSLAKLVRPGTRCVTQFENIHAPEPSLMSPSVRAVRKGLAMLLGSQRIDYNFGTLLRDSDAIVVLSDHHRRSLVTVLDVNDRVTLIPPPPLVPVATASAQRRVESRRRLGLGERDFVVAYFGYVYPRKGLETLGAALQRVVQRRPGVKLVVIGGPLEGAEKYYAEMQQLYRDLGISEVVVWTGFVEDPEELSLHLAAGDICALPIDIGVQLNNSSFAAAAASGLPVLTTRPAQLEAPFIDGRNLLLVPPKEPAALADAIVAVIDDPALRERLAKGALALAKEWFSWETATDRLLTVIASSTAAAASARLGGGSDTITQTPGSTDVPSR
jgi:glycosyltransferase involved in cell wall biosynthesis